jgi:hypothetical protein
MYHGCPILWVSQLQSVFALSTTEAEYVALSTALRDVIPVIELLKEMQEHGYSVDGVPTIKCKLSEDNSGAFEQAKTAKYQPRTRHINAAWHHFRSYEANRLIHIHSIRTDWQLGDTFTKQVSKEDFVGSFSHSKMKECEDMKGLCLRLKLVDLPYSQIYQG